MKKKQKKTLITPEVQATGSGPCCVIRARNLQTIPPKDAYKIWGRQQGLPNGWDVCDPKFAWQGENPPSSPFMTYKEAKCFQERLINRLTQERVNINRNRLKAGASIHNLEIV